MADLIYKDECYKVVGACLEVYREKGSGFHENVFQECLEIEFRLRQLSSIPKPWIELEYKGVKLEAKLQPDFLCFGDIIVELKAVSEITDDHRSQVMNYLKATGKKLGILVNFGHFPGLQWERIVANDKWNESSPTQADLRV